MVRFSSDGTVLFICIYFTILVDLERNLGENRVFKLVKWIGKNVFLIYIVQWLIIGQYWNRSISNAGTWKSCCMVSGNLNRDMFRRCISTIEHKQVVSICESEGRTCGISA